MSQIASISNPDKLVEEKVNFFIDWFHYFIDNVGKNKDFELENPLSLVDKIIFQLDNGKPDNRVTYITNYFSHSFFLVDEYLNCFDSYKEVKPFVTSFNKLPIGKERKDLIKDSEKFRSNLLLLQKQLQDEMFKFSLNSIISYFTCTHKLSEHTADIKYHVQILVTEYLFCDRDKNDLNDVFDKIMSKELEKFPFPNSIKTKRQKNRHISNHNLKQQFEGLINLLNIPAKSANYIFRIYGADLESRISFKYNKVTFYSKDHKKFDLIKDRLASKPIGKFFFQPNQNYILASVPIAIHSEEIAVSKARKEIEIELRYLCWKLDRDLLIDTTRNNLITSNFKQYAWHISSDSYHKQFNTDILPNLNDNPYHTLKKINNKAKSHLLEYEHLYINAMKYRNVPDLWHYFETLLNTKKGEEKNIREQVSSIILNNEMFMHQDRIVRKLSNVLYPHSVDYEKLQLEYSTVQRISQYLIKRKITKPLRNIQYPFIQELTLLYDKKLLIEDYIRVKNYYQSILLEAFEQRNFYIHQASANKKALIKLNYSIFQIAKRFRWALFAETKKHSSIEFPTLIERVIANGNMLCN